jgi:2,4-dienoyl-CoA reductase (NADPH2)
VSDVPTGLVPEAPAGFPHLLAPGRIGTMTVRNRMVMSPMETMYGTPDGLPSDRTVTYFAARARGGVGLITVGATGVDHRHPETPGGLHLGTDEAVAAHRRLVEAVHEHGARIQPQIVHAGPDGLGPEMYGVTSLGPSVIPSYLTGRPSAEVTPAQIREVLDLFRAAVRRAREAGYDGIELHAAHGYMFLGSFLAPQRNRRTDDYRGDRLEGRVQVVLDALAAIRAEVGPGFPVTLRISGYERVAGGRPMWETARVAPLLVEAGVDAFHVSGGVIDRLVTQMVNGPDDGDLLNVGAAAAVRQAVDVPVIAVGRIHDVVRAEQVLADGRADFVAMGRPLLADPELPAKVAAGTPERIRPCISCENCIDAMEVRFAVDCAVNPRTGREAELAVEHGSAPRRVVVVGGGPAGMEAARVAAVRGDRVTLLEAGDRLGGAFAWAAVVHPENAPILHWLQAELVDRGVDVRLGVRASAADVAALDPDAVVLATGGRYVVSPVPGDDLSHVLRGPDLWALPPDAGSLPAGLTGPRRRVVLVGGNQMGLELAELIGAGGAFVTIVDHRPDLAPEIGWKRRTEHMDRLDRWGVGVLVDSVVERITPDDVRVRLVGGARRAVRADAVVLVGEVEAGGAPADDLAAALAAELPGVPLRVVGDAGEPALLRGATESAARALASL